MFSNRKRGSVVKDMSFLHAELQFYQMHNCILKLHVLKPLKKKIPLNNLDLIFRPKKYKIK